MKDTKYQFKKVYGIYEREIKPVLKFKQPNIYYAEIDNGKLFAAGKDDGISMEYNKDTGIFVVYLGRTLGMTHPLPITLKEVDIDQREYGFILWGIDNYGTEVLIHIDLT